MRTYPSACPLLPTRCAVRPHEWTIIIFEQSPYYSIINQFALVRLQQDLSILRQIMSHATPNTVAAKSCLECRRRKIKCDKSIPCSYCVKVKIKCRYPAPKSTPNKVGSSSLSNEALSARIDGIENSLQSFEHSISQIWELLQQPHPPSMPGQNNNQGPGTHFVNGQPSSVERTIGNVCSLFKVPSII